MGLGVDDTFVIMSAYHDTDASMSVVERIRSTSIRAGSSILVTSVTDFVAFLSGTFTSLIALRDFSVYAAVGILFDFVYQITFFLAFLALDARRERMHYDKFCDNEELLLNGISNHNGSVHAYNERLHDGCQEQLSHVSEDEEEHLVTHRSIHKQPIPDRKLLCPGNYTPSPSFASM